MHPDLAIEAIGGPADEEPLAVGDGRRRRPLPSYETGPAEVTRARHARTTVARLEGASARSASGLLGPSQVDEGSAALTTARHREGARSLPSSFRSRRAAATDALRLKPATRAVIRPSRISAAEEEETRLLDVAGCISHMKKAAT